VWGIVERYILIVVVVVTRGEVVSIRLANQSTFSEHNRNTKTLLTSSVSVAMQLKPRFAVAMYLQQIESVTYGSAEHERHSLARWRKCGKLWTAGGRRPVIYAM